MRGGSHANNYPLFVEERVLSAETVPATAGHVAAAGDELRRLADEYVDDLARRHPDAATELGDHRFDELLPVVSEAALADERRVLDRFAARLTDLDGPALEPELRVDAALMAGDVARRLFEIEELREHTWNPLLANPGSAIYMLLARDYAPLPERLHSLAGRLAQVPDALAAARSSLGPMPQVHLETAITQFSGTIALVTEAAADASAVDAAGANAAPVVPRRRIISACDATTSASGRCINTTRYSCPAGSAKRSCEITFTTLPSASDMQSGSLGKSLMRSHSK